MQHFLSIIKSQNDVSIKNFRGNYSKLEKLEIKSNNQIEELFSSNISSERLLRILSFILKKDPSFKPKIQFQLYFENSIIKENLIINKTNHLYLEFFNYHYIYLYIIYYHIFDFVSLSGKKK